MTFFKAHSNRARLAIIGLALLFPIVAFATPTAYTFKNTTNEALGNVTFYTASGSSLVDISSPGDWPIETSGSVTSVTVNGYTVNYPNDGLITLPSGHSGKVTWPTTNVIEVIDLQMGS